MRITILVAGVAVLRGALEDAVNVAICAGNANMGACQFECSQIMVKCSGFPCRRFVAGTAIGTECATVHITRLMAGNTIGWRSFEHTGCGVAFGADSVDMRSG